MSWRRAAFGWGVAISEVQMYGTKAGAPKTGDGGGVWGRARLGKQMRRAVAGEDKARGELAVGKPWVQTGRWWRVQWQGCRSTAGVR